MKRTPLALLKSFKTLKSLKTLKSTKYMNSKSSGMTLIEALVSVAIIAFISVPLLGMIYAATDYNASSHKMTTATFTAQMRIEQLVGLTGEEICEDFDITVPSGTRWQAIIDKADPERTKTDSENFGNQNVSTTVRFYPVIDEIEYEYLVEVTVTVTNNADEEIYSVQKNILNIMPGGGAA
ncbi:MAG: type II secretion system GspH family protein [Oscillospiraceae bacterium]|nr:type II secretion system GspH family protein [Oscillospiraceae bacterium]